MPAYAVQARGVSHRYGKTQALDNIDLDIHAGQMVGLIGPDGVGKSTLLSLIAGARALQTGELLTLGGDMRNARHRTVICPRIAYMPQGLGRNLYPTLSVEENLQFFGRLFGHRSAERRQRIDALTQSTGLYEFLDRPAGKLSGGMKQKLGLCCALIHDPDLLILDEPTTGVDPLARRQFWELIGRIRQERAGMTVLVATAYMEEAERFDQLVALDNGRILVTGPAAQLRAATGTTSLEDAFIALLPEEKRRLHQPVVIPQRNVAADSVAIEARELTMRFGDFTAVDHVSFRIMQGEIFGFLGSNGCGKTTTMKMLTGLLPLTEGQAWLFGQPVNPDDLETRRRVGYMAQTFSLYSELTVWQNLKLHAQLFHVPPQEIQPRIERLVKRFSLEGVLHALPNSLPLGMRQRLSLAVAVVHSPDILILDEPTSGVDPIARDSFWQLIVDLSRQDNVTIFISTHFMQEAERCDRISFMHAGKVLVSNTPANLKQERGVNTLEDAFVAYLEDAIEDIEGQRFVSGQASQPTAARVARQPKSELADGNVSTITTDNATPRTQRSELTRPQAQDQGIPAAARLHAHQRGAHPRGASWSIKADRDLSTPSPQIAPHPTQRSQHMRRPPRFSLNRLLTYAHVETLQLQRDPVRRALAFLGTVVLMFIIGYGISMDVEDLPYAILDRDQTSLSHAYALNLSGSRYFIERPPILDYGDLDARMRSGELALAIELPPGFARDVQRGAKVEIGAWIDGANPQRADTIQGYLQGMHTQWLLDLARHRLGVEPALGAANIETRFRYNPDIESLPAIVPAVIPLLLLLIPAMLAALAVVREKELGSIINFYVTPVRRTEFLLGKQLPYIAIGMLNYLMMVMLAVTVFGVPLTGSFMALTLASLIFVMFATGFGLFASSFTRSQIAAMFLTMIGTMLPAVQFSGLLNPVSSLEGLGALIGQLYPATYMLTISRGVFAKGLDLFDLGSSVWPLVVSVPVILTLATLLLKKQDR